ncbi:MAG: hypothetical protein JWN23_625 [Rhodocyclales bacterium]|nr:hypothetical protein [Rhodocyclales bacterium]
MIMTNSTPSSEELQQLGIRAYRGIELGLGESDPGAAISAKLEVQYPGHLVLVQAGTFLHGYDRTAHALSTLKQYKLKLVGTANDPHLRVGFPLGNFKRRLWQMVDEFGIPYVVALGTQASGRTIYTSNQPTGNTRVLAAISQDIISQVIDDLRQRGELNKASVKQMLTHPDSTGFKLKSHAVELDTMLMQDIVKMPRDLRTTYGENVRICMARIMHGVMGYGVTNHKVDVLHGLSGDIDLLKHYLIQAKQLSQLKFAFAQRAGLAVELGRLLGGMLNAQRTAS